MDSGNSKDSRYRTAKRLIAWSLTVFVVSWLVAEAFGASRGPFEGRVVDADTRQPIPGAVVFVEWLLGHVTVAGRVDTFYDAAEVLTDEHGHFRIGRKSSWNPWWSGMLNAPLLIYKAGYGPVTVADWTRLKQSAAFMKTRTEEDRKRSSPTLLYKIEFEQGLPVFLLKQLTLQERQQNLSTHPLYAESKQYKLLLKERNREARATGQEDAVFPVPEE